MIPYSITALSVAIGIVAGYLWGRSSGRSSGIKEANENIIHSCRRLGGFTYGNTTVRAVEVTFLNPLDPPWPRKAPTPKSTTEVPPCQQ